MTLNVSESTKSFLEASNLVPRNISLNTYTNAGIKGVRKFEDLYLNPTSVNGQSYIKDNLSSALPYCFSIPALYSFVLSFQSLIFDQHQHQVFFERWYLAGTDLFLKLLYNPYYPYSVAASPVSKFEIPGTWELSTLSFSSTGTRRDRLLDNFCPFSQRFPL